MNGTARHCDDFVHLCVSYNRGFLVRYIIQLLFINTCYKEYSNYLLSVWMWYSNRRLRIVFWYFSNPPGHFGILDKNMQLFSPIIYLWLCKREFCVLHSWGDPGHKKTQVTSKTGIDIMHYYLLPYLRVRFHLSTTDKIWRSSITYIPHPQLAQEEHEKVILEHRKNLRYLLSSSFLGRTSDTVWRSHIEWEILLLWRHLNG